MSNQTHNSDFFVNMKDDPMSTIGRQPTELLTAADWTDYYYLEATRYQAFINLTSNK